MLNKIISKLIYMLNKIISKLRRKQKRENKSVQEILEGSKIRHLSTPRPSNVGHGKGRRKQVIYEPILVTVPSVYTKAGKLMREAFTYFKYKRKVIHHN